MKHVFDNGDVLLERRTNTVFDVINGDPVQRMPSKFVLNDNQIERGYFTVMSKETQ